MSRDENKIETGQCIAVYWQMWVDSFSAFCISSILIHHYNVCLHLPLIIPEILIHNGALKWWSILLILGNKRAQNLVIPLAHKHIFALAVNQFFLAISYWKRMIPDFSSLSWYWLPISPLIRDVITAYLCHLSRRHPLHYLLSSIIDILRLILR